MARVAVAAILCLATLALLAPDAAQAQDRMCQGTLIRDWYVDGRIQGKYPAGCYRAVLVEVPEGPVYSTLRTELTRALANATPAPASTERENQERALYLAVMSALLLLLVAWVVARRRSAPRR